mgnify:CR=1 FL=1
MKGTDNETGRRRGTSVDDARLEELLRAAGRRQTPPEAAREEVFAAAHAHWQTQLRSRRRRKQRTSWTAAAAAAVAGIAALLLLPPPVPPGSELLYTLVADRLVGTAALRTETDDSWHGLGLGEVLVHSGTALRTSRASGLGLVYPDGRSLRVNENSEIRFGTDGRITLRSGSLYMDSGPDGIGTGDVVIETHLGLVREIGTRFETRVSDDAVRVRVREGRVETVRGGETWTAEASEELEVRKDGPPRRGAVEAWSPAWQWVEALAPAPYADDITVADLLEWVGRETGRRIHFVEPGLERQAYLTVLHGNPHRFTPMEALSVMLQTTDLQYTVAGNEEILIGTRSVTVSR